MALVERLGLFRKRKNEERARKPSQFWCQREEGFLDIQRKIKLMTRNGSELSLYVSHKDRLVVRYSFESTLEWISLAWEPNGSNKLPVSESGLIIKRFEKFFKDVDPDENDSGLVDMDEDGNYSIDLGGGLKLTLDPSQKEMVYNGEEKLVIRVIN